jgi:hypothetical protein
MRKKLIACFFMYGCEKWIRLFSKEAAKTLLRVLTASFCFFAVPKEEV